MPMPKITFSQSDGSSITVDASLDQSVMQAAVAAGIDGILAECGGNAMCSTCHVYVEPEQLGLLADLSAEEDDMLDCAEAERRSNSRLACQLPVTTDLDGLRLEVPDAF